MKEQNLLKSKILGIGSGSSVVPVSPSIGGDPEEVLELLKK